MKSEWKKDKSAEGEKKCRRATGKSLPRQSRRGGVPGRSRSSSSVQLYFNTAIRLTAFLLIESFIYSTFTLSPMSGGLESKKVLYPHQNTETLPSSPLTWS